MPTSYAVLDSGILLATIQTETFTKHAQTLLSQFEIQQTQLIAPVLLRYELVSVVRKWVYRELTTPDKAKIALTTLMNHPITVIVDNDLLHRAYELATEFNHPAAYDAQYLALAERFQCDFWTADERLFNRIYGAFPRAYWLGNVKLEV